MKRYLKLISIFLIFVVLFNVVFAEKVKAATITATLGGIVFASLLVASGITFLNKSSIDKLYSKWLEVKPPSVNWTDFVMTAINTSFVAGRFAFDKASEVVSSVVDFVRDKINVLSGEATINLEAGSYYNDGLSIKNVTFNKVQGKQLVFYVGKYKFVFQRYSNGYSLFSNAVDSWAEIINVKTDYNDYYYDRADAVYITHFNIEEYYDDITGDVDYVLIDVGLKIRLKYENGYRWTDYKEVKGKKITSRHLGIPSVVNPDNLVHLHVDEYSVVSGGEIRENIVNPILPLTLEKGIEAGIYTRKGDTLTYEGNIESLVADLDVYYDDVLSWYVNRSYTDVNSLPYVPVSVGEGVLTLPYVDVGDISVPSDPSIPSIPDIFEPGDKSIDWSPLMDIGISEKFPFCLPFDFMRGLEVLLSPPQVPTWKIPIMGSEITIDFSQFENLAKISRFFFTLMYVYVLILVTKRIMGGQ